MGVVVVLAVEEAVVAEGAAAADGIAAVAFAAVVEAAVAAAASDWPWQKYTRQRLEVMILLLVIQFH